MTSKIYKSLGTFLLLLALSTGENTDKSISDELAQPANDSSVTEVAERGGRGLLTPFNHPLFQWRVNAAPWDGLPSFGFSDPLAALLPTSRDVEEIDRDREPLSPRPSDDPGSAVSGFGGILSGDQFSSLDGIGGILNIFENGPSRKPWWKGPNVCVEREETADTTEAPSDPENNKNFFNFASVNMQTCHSTETKYECVHKVQSRGVRKSFIVRHQCCLGYRRKGGMGYCEKFDLESMMDTIKKLNASDFIVRNGFENKLANENLTLFLPTDAAFKSMAEGLLESNNIDMNVVEVRRRRGIDGMSPSQLVDAHTVSGFHDLTPDSVLNSKYQNSTLLIDRYVGSNGELQYLVNCAKIVSPNNYATTGIVHTVDRVLFPVTKNIMEEISSHPEFSTFKQVLEKTGLDKDLSEDETWTIFIPTNDAFSKLDKRTLEMVTKGDSTSKNIIKSHFLGPVLCSSVIETGVIGVTNANGDIIRLSAANKTISNEIETDTSALALFNFGDIPVIKADMMATHGVIHAIDQVYIPESAMPLVKLLMKENLTSFAKIIEDANMMDEIDRMSNVTFLVPTNEAIEAHFKSNEPSEVSSLLEGEGVSTTTQVTMDESKGREFVLHHIMEGALPSYEMENNMIRKTLHAQPDLLRINLYSTMPLFANTYNRATANCARIVNFGLQQRDNLIHLVGKAVPRVTDSILDIIKKDRNLTTLMRVLSDTQLEKDLSTMTDITFLAPTNEVFNTMSKEDFEILINNKKLADSLIRQHTVQGVMCCSGLRYSPWPFTASVRSITGQTLALHNNRIGSALVSDCDHIATNGVLHLTASIMFPPQRRNMNSENPNVDIFLYGI